MEPFVQYLCAQTHLKLHPVFLAILARIILEDPCGQLTLLGLHAKPNLYVVRRIVAAVAAGAGLAEPFALFNTSRTPPMRMCGIVGAVAPALARIRIAPFRPFNPFQELLAVADVAIDPHPFGERCHWRPVCSSSHGTSE